MLVNKQCEYRAHFCISDYDLRLWRRLNFYKYTWRLSWKGTKWYLQPAAAKPLQSANVWYKSVRNAVRWRRTTTLRSPTTKLRPTEKETNDTESDESAGNRHRSSASGQYHSRYPGGIHGRQRISRRTRLYRHLVQGQSAFYQLAHSCVVLSFTFTVHFELRFRCRTVERREHWTFLNSNTLSNGLVFTYIQYHLSKLKANLICMYILAKHIPTGDGNGRDSFVRDLQLRSTELDQLEWGRRSQRFRWSTGSDGRLQRRQRHRMVLLSVLNLEMLANVRYVPGHGGMNKTHSTSNNWWRYLFRFRIPKLSPRNLSFSFSYVSVHVIVYYLVII